MAVQLAGVCGSKQKKERKTFSILIGRQRTECRPEQVLGWLLVDKGQSYKTRGQKELPGTAGTSN